MQAKTDEIKTTNERINHAITTGHKRFFRCAGRIMNKKSRLYGQLCNKILSEANSKGQIAGRIKCSHCGYVNEV